MCLLLGVPRFQEENRRHLGGGAPRKGDTHSAAQVGTPLSWAKPRRVAWHHLAGRAWPLSPGSWGFLAVLSCKVWHAAQSHSNISMKSHQLKQGIGMAPSSIQATPRCRSKGRRSSVAVSTVIASGFHHQRSKTTSELSAERLTKFICDVSRDRGAEVLPRTERRAPSLRTSPAATARSRSWWRWSTS